MSKLIDRNTLQSKLASARPPLLLEALPARHYEDAHLPGALHMPHDDVKRLAPELAPRRETEIVVYCANANCQNSHIAAERLRAMGYTDVSVYAGGKQDWKDAGLPLEQGLPQAV